MDPETNIPPKRQRWVVPLLAVLFFGPLLAAWLFYFTGDGWRPGGSVNHGRLLAPTVTLAAFSPPGSAAGAPSLFRENWTLLVMGDQRCEAACRDVLDKVRRVRLALRQEAPRVRRVLLSEPPPPSDQDTGLSSLSVLDPPGRAILAGIEEAAGAQVQVRAQVWSVFVVDPLGNVIMVFQPDFEMRGMLADLKRLLRLSRIG